MNNFNYLVKGTGFRAPLKPICISQKMYIFFPVLTASDIFAQDSKFPSCLLHGYDRIPPACLGQGDY